MRKELNKFPFTEAATLLLTEQGYTMPIGMFIDANIYPMCQNNPPFYVHEFTESGGCSHIKVCDAQGIEAFVIYVPHAQGDADYAVGYCRTATQFCGSCLLSKQCVDFLRAIPRITNINPTSLPFSASAIRPIPDTVPDVDDTIKFNGEPINEVVWGENLTGGTVESDVVSTPDMRPTPVKAIVVNGVEITGECVYITPSRNSSIRVINDNGVTIGKISEL